MTLLKGNKNKNKNKKILSIIGLVFLIVAVFAGIVLVQENQDIREDAAGIKCSNIKDMRSCEGTCGPTKSNGQSFECRWGKNGCVETSKLCNGGGGASLSAVCSGQCAETCSGGTTATMSRDCMNQYPAKYCCVVNPTFPLPSDAGGAGPIPNAECHEREQQRRPCGFGIKDGKVCLKSYSRVCTSSLWGKWSACTCK